ALHQPVERSIRRKHILRLGGLCRRRRIGDQRVLGNRKCRSRSCGKLENTPSPDRRTHGGSDAKLTHTSLPTMFGPDRESFRPKDIILRIKVPLCSGPRTDRTFLLPLLEFARLPSDLIPNRPGEDEDASGSGSADSAPSKTLSDCW